MEPEITRAALKLNNNFLYENVTVAMQLARAPMELVYLLRPGLPQKGLYDNWFGVRRFVLDNSAGGVDIHSKLSLVSELRNVNMANPLSLQDFLVWGLSVIQAHYYMVILSGHGAGFIGAMADFTHGGPQIMGLPQIAAVIKGIKKYTGKKINIVMMDACYMNLIENLYEFSMGDGIAEIFIGNSGLLPLEGYGYLNIVNFCTQGYEPRELAVIIKNYYDSKTEYGCTDAIILNNKLFDLLKQKLSELGKRFYNLGITPGHFSQGEDNLVNLQGLFSRTITISKDKAIGKCINKSLNVLTKLKVNDSINDKYICANCFCPRSIEEFLNFTEFYTALKFSEDNYWLQWLAQGKKQYTYLDHNDICTSLSPLKLPLSMLTQHLLSLNPNMSINDIYHIYTQLGWS